MSAGAGAASAPKSYLILAKGEKLPANVAAQVQAAGGTLTSTIPQVGIAVASTTSVDFKAKAAKIGTVVPNVKIQLVDPLRTVEGPIVDFANPPSSGDNDAFFDLQYGHDTVDAPEAWNAGERGDGVRVAVLDTGFDTDHPDLAPNVDFPASRDFTGEGLTYHFADPFSHGSHTAGTVAAADNGIGTIGVAPEATLILVKMLRDEGIGTFADGIAAIVYAAGPADADVISMSWGARVPKAGDPTDPELDTPEKVAELKHALNLATRFAFKQGATLVASAGNDGENYDENVGILSLPAMADNVLAISATTPIGWAVNPALNKSNNIASYSNYGNSIIDFSAPGGDPSVSGERELHRRRAHEAVLRVRPRVLDGQQSEPGHRQLLLVRWHEHGCSARLRRRGDHHRRARGKHESARRRADPEAVGRRSRGPAQVLRARPGERRQRRRSVARAARRLTEGPALTGPSPFHGLARVHRGFGLGNGH